MQCPTVLVHCFVWRKHVNLICRTPSHLHTVCYMETSRNSWFVWSLISLSFPLRIMSFRTWKEPLRLTVPKPFFCTAAWGLAVWRAGSGRHALHHSTVPLQCPRGEPGGRAAFLSPCSLLRQLIHDSFVLGFLLWRISFFSVKNEKVVVKPCSCKTVRKPRREKAT